MPDVRENLLRGDLPGGFGVGWARPTQRRAGSEMPARFPVGAVPSEATLTWREEADHDGGRRAFERDRIRVDAEAEMLTPSPPHR